MTGPLQLFGYHVYEVVSPTRLLHCLALIKHCRFFSALLPKNSTRVELYSAFCQIHSHLMFSKQQQKAEICPIFVLHMVTFAGRRGEMSPVCLSCSQTGKPCRWNWSSGWCVFDSWRTCWCCRLCSWCLQLRDRWGAQPHSAPSRPCWREAEVSHRGNNTLK